MNYKFNGILVVEQTGDNFRNTTFDEVYNQLKAGGVVGVLKTETTSGGITRTGVIFPYMYYADNQYTGYDRVIIVGGVLYHEGDDGGLVRFTV